MTATPGELMTASLLNVFGERDPVKRREAMGRTFAEDVTFHDPEGSVTGYEALEEKVTDLQGGAPPDWVFQLVAPAAGVADLGRVAWGFGPPGAPVVRGMDIGIISGGRIATMYTIVDAGA